MAATSGPPGQNLDGTVFATTNLVVVFEARRIKGVTPLRFAGGYPRKARKISPNSHTDRISPSLAAEGAVHE